MKKGTAPAKGFMARRRIYSSGEPKDDTAVGTKRNDFPESVQLIRQKDGTIEIREPLAEETDAEKCNERSVSDESGENHCEGSRNRRRKIDDDDFAKLMATLDKHVEAEKEEERNEKVDSRVLSRAPSNIPKGNNRRNNPKEVAPKLTPVRIERRIGNLRFFVEPPAVATSSSGRTSSTIDATEATISKEKRDSRPVQLRNPSSLGIFSKKIVERSADTMISPDSCTEETKDDTDVENGRPLSLFRRGILAGKPGGGGIPPVCE